MFAVMCVCLEVVQHVADVDYHFLSCAGARVQQVDQDLRTGGEAAFMGNLCLEGGAACVEYGSTKGELRRRAGRGGGHKPEHE